jgi:hypothetical protein
MLPMVAVTVTIPPEVMPDTMLTVPAETVARFVLLEVQVATSLTSGEPLHVVATASREIDGAFVVTVPLVGLILIAVMHPTVTVTLCVPVIDGFWLEVAVTVAVPVATDVTSPVLETVATVVGVTVQVTDGLLLVLPSLLVANTVICTVLSVVPVSIVGLAGPTAIELRVGFTKNPVQLTAKANEAKTANAPIKRKVFFFDDISISVSSELRPQDYNGPDTKIVAEDARRNAHRST